MHYTYSETILWHFSITASSICTCRYILCNAHSDREDDISKTSCKCMPKWTLAIIRTVFALAWDSLFVYQISAKHGIVRFVALSRCAYSINLSAARLTMDCAGPMPTSLLHLLDNDTDCVLFHSRSGKSLFQLYYNVPDDNFAFTFAPIGHFVVAYNQPQVLQGAHAITQRDCRKSVSSTHAKQTCVKSIHAQCRPTRTLAGLRCCIWPSPTVAYELVVLCLRARAFVAPPGQFSDTCEFWQSMYLILALSSCRRPC